MKKCLTVLLICMISVSAQAVIIDDFSGGLSTWTSTVILDANGGGSNSAAWQVSGGVLQLNTTTYDGIEQYAMIKSGLTLGVGEEVQIKLVHNLVSQDLGVYVGGTAPQTGVRQDYIAMYGRSSGEVFSRGFDGTSEYGQVGWVSPAYEKLFITRTDTNTFEAGYYEGGVRTVLVTRTPTTPNAATVVGFYADVRAAGVLGDLDNLAMVGGKWDSYLPYAPSVQQVQDITGVDVTLNWKAAADPNEDITGYAVNPDIVDEYVFMSDGSGTDPNLYYAGATGDPGTADPNSSFIVQDLPYDSTYYWAVVEAMNGYTQSFTVGLSTLSDVDPNNVIGPTWVFGSLTSVPVIMQQPADSRVFDTEPNVVFACEFTSISTATVDWYKSGVATPLADDTDYNIYLTDDGNGNYVAALEILSPSLSDEGSYYCTIDNGTPLVTSNTASLIINQLLAQYDLDGTLSSAVGSAADAPTGQGKSLDGLAEPNSLLASNVTLTFVEGIDAVAGHAVQIDPNQYVDFGTAGYPKASDLTNGLGRGLDEGTVICWVKPTTTGGILANFNDGATTGCLLSLAANSETADTRMIVRGDSAVYTEIGTAQGRPGRPAWDMFDGAWHLVASTWSAGGTLSVYVDGQQVASVAGGVPDGYLPWQRGVLLGAGRSGDRVVLSELLGSVVDNLRVYNYEIDADVIAQEYLNVTGIHPCVNGGFVGSYYNTDDTGSSYCQVDLADFADFAAIWLANGLF